MRVKRAAYGFAWVLLATANAAAGSRSADAWSWANENADAAWKQLAAGLDPVEPDRTVDWTVHIVAADGWGRTAELRVRQPWDGPPTVAYLRTVGENLLTQLHDLREAAPVLSVSEAAGRLQVRGGTIDTADCRPLQSVVERLPKVQMPPLADNHLTLHPVTYEVTLSPSHRSERRLVVEAGDDDLAKWCGKSSRQSWNARPVRVENEPMPIKSKAQRRKFAELLVEGKITPETFEEWNRGAGSKELPERLHPERKPKRKAAKKKAARKKTPRTKAARKKVARKPATKRAARRTTAR